MKKIIFINILMIMSFPYIVLSSVGDCPTTGTSTNTQYLNSTLTLKILLVEFSDVKHRSTKPIQPNNNYFL